MSALYTALLEGETKESLAAMVVNLHAALAVPAVWSEEEREGMARVYYEAVRKHGLYETLFAVAAWLLRHRMNRAMDATP